MPVSLLNFSLNYALFLTTLLPLVNTSTVAVGLSLYTKQSNWTFFPVEIHFQALFLSSYHTSTPTFHLLKFTYSSATHPPLGKKKKKKKKLLLRPRFPSTLLSTLFAVTTTTIPEIYPGPSSLPLSPIGPAAVSIQRFLYSVSYLAEQSNLILKIYRASLLFLFSNSVLDSFLKKK